MFLNKYFQASLVQLVERESPKFEAEGSNPSGRARIKKIIWRFESIIKIMETN